MIHHINNERTEIMAKILIRIGHSAYKDANAYRLCFSKAQAVRVLRNRGLKRDDARIAVNKALKDQGATVYGAYGQVVEIANEDFGLINGHFIYSYEQMRSNWSKSSEL
jgi:hypothetical protein